MTKFTNTTRGPKGVNGKDGLVMIDGGKAADVEVSAGEHKSASATGWFDIDGDAPEATLDDNTVAELKAIAKAESIDLGDATKKADIVAAIELSRED